MKVLMIALFLSILVVSCAPGEQVPPTDPVRDDTPTPRTGIPSDAQLSSCDRDDDCIPLPSQCHPERCINGAYEDAFDKPDVCTEVFLADAAYTADDCICQSGVCTNKNKNLAESNLPPGATKCEGPRSDICTQEYRPVCGWYKETISCITEPCAITTSNPCTACSNPDVAYWTEGACDEA